jgi:hypothetical protein
MFSHAESTAEYEASRQAIQKEGSRRDKEGEAQGRQHYERRDDVVTRSSKRVNTTHITCIHIKNMSFLQVKARREGCSLIQIVENVFFKQRSSLLGRGI